MALCTVAEEDKATCPLRPEEYYRYFCSLLAQAAAQSSVPLKDIQDDGSMNRTIEIYARHLPLQEVDFGTPALAWILNEISELTLMNLIDAPLGWWSASGWGEAL